MSSPLGMNDDHPGSLGGIKGWDGAIAGIVCPACAAEDDGPTFKSRAPAHRIDALHSRYILNWVDAQANLPTRARWNAKANVASI